MAHPWEPQPFPTRFDANEADTFQGVGRVLTTWEHIEFGLARLYSIFARAPGTEAIFGYKGTIFRERLNSLRAQAETYFVGHPCQELEGALDASCSMAEQFADRRNEVAHGAVFDVSLLGMAERPAFALIPPYHIVKRYQDDQPLYGYTSYELAELNHRLRAALGDIHTYRRQVMAALGVWLEGHV